MGLDRGITCPHTTFQVISRHAADKLARLFRSMTENCPFGHEPIGLTQLSRTAACHDRSLVLALTPERPSFEKPIGDAE